MDGCGGIRALARWEVGGGSGWLEVGIELGEGGCCVLFGLAWPGHIHSTGQVGILVLYSYPGTGTGYYISNFSRPIKKEEPT